MTAAESKLYREIKAELAGITAQLEQLACKITDVLPDLRELHSRIAGDPVTRVLELSADELELLLLPLQNVLLLEHQLRFQQLLLELPFHETN